MSNINIDDLVAKLVAAGGVTIVQNIVQNNQYNHLDIGGVKKGDDPKAVQDVVKAAKQTAGKKASTPPVWVAASGGEIPPNAVHAATMHGKKVYVIRAMHAGSMIPGKVVEGEQHAYISYDYKEHGKHEYEVLVDDDNDIEWIKGTCPTMSKTDLSLKLLGGFENNKTPLYIARVQDGTTGHVGKVNPSHRMGYFPYGGKENCIENFEVLCLC